MQTTRTIGLGTILFLLVSICSVGQMTNTIYAPAMSNIAYYFGVPPTRVQLVMAAYLFPYGFSQFFYGPLSDRFGRRPLLLIGLIIYLIGSFIALSAPIFHLLVLGSFIQGCGVGVGGVMLRTVLRDLYYGVKLHQASSYISIAMIFAPIMAPMLGGGLAHYLGWRSIFIFLFSLGATVWLIQFFMFPETNPHRGTEQTRLRYVKSSYLTVLSNRRFLGYMVCLLVGFGGVSVFEASAGILFTHVLHFTPLTASLLYTIPMPAYLGGSYLSGWLSSRWITPHIVLLGIVFLIVGGFSLLLVGLWVTSVLSILVPVCCYFFGIGMVFPAGTAGALEPFSALAGTAGAIMGGVQNVGASAATMISSTMSQTSQIPLAFILSGLSLLMALAYYCFLHEGSKKDEA